VPDHPNFYVLLELDPSVDDWAVIERRIEEKKELWSRNSTMGSPKVKSEAKRNLGFVPTMRENLSDPAKRRQEAAEARRLQEEARSARERELEDLIDVLRSTGTGVCNDEQFDRLVRQFAGAFTPEEISERLAAAGLHRPGPEAEEAPEPPREALDPKTAGDIREHLKSLGKRDLYDFLGLPASSPTGALRSKADDVYKDSLQKGNTPQATATNALAGICLMLFKGEEGRRKYDAFREQEVLEVFRERIDLAAAQGVLTPEAVDRILQYAVSREIDGGEARRLLERYARQKGWTILRTSGRPSPPPPPETPEPPKPRPAPGSHWPDPPVVARRRRPPLAKPALGASAAAGLVAAVFLILPTAPATTGPGTAQAPAAAAPASSSAAGGSAAGGQGAQGTAASPGGPSAGPASPAAGAAATWTATGGATAGAATPNRADASPLPPPAAPPVPPDPAHGAATLPERGILAREAAGSVGLSARPLPPGDPIVAVLSTGDPALAGTLEEEIARGLRRDGLDVRSARGALPSGRGAADLPRLLPRLADAGFHVVVVADVEFLGERELRFYGRTEIASSVRLRVQAYPVDGGSPLGSGWRDQVEYTPLNAEDRAAAAARSFLPDLAAAIRAAG
jgi:hypothetical protein